MSDYKDIKVGIIGLGPVGMILAAKFREAGCQVALCVRNDVKKNQLLSQGIVLENILPTTAHFDQVYTNIKELAHLDLDFLVFATKSYHVAELISEVEILNSERLTVIIAQNGIDVENLYTPTFKESQILRLVMNFAGNITAPNTVKVNFFTPPNYLGSINDTQHEKAVEISNLLSQVQLTTQPVDSFELLRRVWYKTILNSSVSPLCGVGRLTMAEAMSDPDTIELVEQTISEAVEVAEKEKIRFSDDFIRQCLRYLKKGGDHFPSLALDLINGRQTEIDHFNGKIVEFGRKHYLRTSLNLSFTNMVKAMTNKNIILKIPGTGGEVGRKILDKAMVKTMATGNSYKNTACFLGIDLGSAYTKFTVIDEKGNPIFRYSLPTMTSDKQAFKNVMTTIASNFMVQFSCATGYGRKHFTQTDIFKTEINCAAAGVSFDFPGEKNIIDIGGEDIKVIRCNAENNVENFYMNDKCAAGTGSFLAEIAEKAQINISEMSGMAALSNYDKELNSFCTVFAKTEIMNWIFDGMSLEDISRGIYISIANRVAKLRIDPGIPIYMIGGVIEHHPYLKIILSSRFDREIEIVENAQFIVSYGAAIIARNAFSKKTKKSNYNQVDNI